MLHWRIVKTSDIAANGGSWAPEDYIPEAYLQHVVHIEDTASIRIAQYQRRLQEAQAIERELLELVSHEGIVSQALRARIRKLMTDK